MRTLIGRSVAATALAAVVVAVVVNGEDEAPRQPTEAVRPPFAIYGPRDAVPAIENRDYQVEHRVAAADAKKAVAMLPNGDLVLLDRHRLIVLSPSTGQRQQLGRLGPQTVTPHVTLLSSGELWRSLSGHSGRPEDPADRYLRAERFDPGTGEVQRFTAPHVPQDRTAAPYGTMLPGTDGRFYFTTGRNCAADRGCGGKIQLWSFDPGQPGEVRMEASSLEEFAMAGSVLTWAEDSGSSRAIVHTRDLGTGQEHTRTINGYCVHSSSPEEGPAVLASSALIVLRLGCGQEAAPEHLVLDTRAQPLAQFRFDSHGVIGVGDRWVVLGNTAYDSKTGRLLRIRRVLWRESPLFGRSARPYDPAATAGRRILFRAGASPRGTWAYAQMSPK